MKDITDPTLNKHQGISTKFIPLLFLFVLVLAYGIFIPQLGIYQDDWVFVYNAYARGAEGLRVFLNADGSPFSSFINVGLFQVLGLRPVYWHISALLARELTVVGCWLLLRKLWPQSSRQILWVCLVFAVHPFYILQPLSFTFLHIWLAYGLLVYSLYWMILALDDPKRFWLFTVLSFAAGAVALMTTEYFAGLELLRPVLLWFYLRNEEKSARIMTVIKSWIPYTFILVIYSFWRFFIYQVPIAGRNDPVVLKSLLHAPLSGFKLIITNIVPDTVSIVITAWFKLIDTTHLDLTYKRDLSFIVFSVLAAFSVYYLLRPSTLHMDNSLPRQNVWQREAFWLGLFILLLGLVPPYVGGLFINEKNPLWNSRFGLASMLGAALLLIVFLEYLTTDFKTRLIVLSIMLGFSIGYHARYTNDFRYAWKKEQNLFRQLVTRIPSLQNNTALIAEGEILPYMGDYPTAYAINTLYAQPKQDYGPNAKYWFFGITTNFGDRIDEFMGGSILEASHRSISFTGQAEESVMFSFEPAQNECLHVIRPEDTFFRYLPPLLRRSASLSALNRIGTDASVDHPFLAAIGVYSVEDWCNYYQRADLARQAGDWQKVVALWKTARMKGLSAGSYFEDFLFLDTFIQLGKWEDATKLSLEMRKIYPISRRPLCDYWNALPPSPERDSTFKSLDTRLKCFEK